MKPKSERTCSDCAKWKTFSKSVKLGICRSFSGFNVPACCENIWADDNQAQWCRAFNAKAKGQK